MQCYADGNSIAARRPALLPHRHIATPSSQRARSASFVPGGRLPPPLSFVRRACRGQTRGRCNPVQGSSAPKRPARASRRCSGRAPRDACCEGESPTASRIAGRCGDADVAGGSGRLQTASRAPHDAIAAWRLPTPRAHASLTYRVLTPRFPFCAFSLFCRRSPPASASSRVAPLPPPPVLRAQRLSRTKPG